MSQSQPDSWTMAALQQQLAQLGHISRDVALKLHTTGQAMQQIGYALNYIRNRYGGSPPMAFYGPEHFSAEDQDLKIGSLFGVRYWTVTTPWHDDAGQPVVRLKGARDCQWQAGENVAWCLNMHAVRVPVRNGHIVTAEEEASWPFSSDLDYTTRPHNLNEIPTKSCGCGFWVYWSPDAAFGNISLPDVAGVVEGWGGYRTGTKGFRCSKAKVVALAVVPRDESWRTLLEGVLADVYQVPVFSELATMLKRFPPSREGTPSPDPAGWQPVVPGLPLRGYARGGNIPPGWQNVPVSASGVFGLTGIVCMTCHQRNADTITRPIASQFPVYHCSSCPPPAQPCSCASHYFAPARPASQPPLLPASGLMVGMDCSCGRRYYLQPGDTAGCQCGTVHHNPAPPVLPPPNPLSPIDALAILDARKDPPE